MTVWRRLRRASEKGTGLTLSADDLREMVKHGSIDDEISEQLHYEDASKVLNDQDQKE